MNTRSLNRVQLIGNLTRDPEMRQLNSGTLMCTFSLATNRSWNVDGVPHEDTDYHRVVVWAKLAEICNSLLRKSDHVFIEGRLSTRKYTDRSGAERETTEVVADDMILLSHKDKPADIMPQ